MPKQMMIFASLYQNNGTGRDTFINMYRKGSGRTGEPGAYQGCCGHYGGGITRYSGFQPYIEPEEGLDTKPYSCHKELMRPLTSSPSRSPHERKTQWSDGSRRLNYDQLITTRSAEGNLLSPHRPRTSRADVGFKSGSRQPSRLTLRPPLKMPFNAFVARGNMHHRGIPSYTCSYQEMQQGLRHIRQVPFGSGGPRRRCTTCGMHLRASDERSKQ